VVAVKHAKFIIDAENGCILEANSYAEELTGYSKDMLLKKKIWEIKLQVEFDPEILEFDGRKACRCIAYSKPLAGDILQNISHELRTPLTAILGSVDLLKDEETNEEKAALFDLSKRNLWRLNTLIDDLLQLEEIQTGRKRISPQSLDTVEIVQQAISELRDIADMKGIRIEAPLDGNLVVTGDREAIKRIFTNLLSNATKFNREGGRIVISAEEEGDFVKFSVSDTGIGIPEEELGKIFDRFYQVDRSPRRKYPGMGVGLSIVKELVEMQGGNIWVESKPGKGSTFIFTLPRRRGWPR
jgi:signal transduction histidine kinase